MRRLKKRDNKQKIISFIFSLVSIVYLYNNVNFQYEHNHLATVMFIDFEAFKVWFLSLGGKYNVNPWLFGGIYVGAIPFFTLSVGRLIRNYKKNKSIVLPALSAGFFFISAYLYLIVAGENVPWWVYGFVMLMLIYGAYSTFKKIKKQVEVKNEL